MYQTLFGLGLIILGFVTAVFNKRCALVSRAIGRRTGSLVFPLKLARTVNVIAGVLCVVGGLLLLLGVMSLPPTLR